MQPEFSKFAKKTFTFALILRTCLHSDSLFPPSMVLVFWNRLNRISNRFLWKGWFQVGRVFRDIVRGMCCKMHLTCWKRAILDFESISAVFCSNISKKSSMRYASRRWKKTGIKRVGVLVVRLWQQSAFLIIYPPVSLVMILVDKAMLLISSALWTYESKS